MVEEVKTDYRPFLSYYYIFYSTSVVILNLNEYGSLVDIGLSVSDVIQNVKLL